MKQFLVFVRKEFYHVFRDHKTLLLLFGLPIAQIVLFGFALTNEIKHSSIAVLDYAKDASSQQFIQKLSNSPQFHVQEVLYQSKQKEQVFKEGKVKLIVVIPPQFEKELIKEGNSQIQLIADASDPNTANTLVVYASAIIRDFQAEMSQIQQLPYQLQVDMRFLYNPELKGAPNFVPGVMALILSLISVLMTSVSIVREKENGTMEILLVSPFNPLLVILSKVVPYLVLSFVNLTIILLLSVSLLDMPIRGSIVLLYVESLLLIITALSLGLLISNVTNSQQVAMIASLLGMLLPTLLFSGFMFPLENMPLALQYFSNIVPAKWYFIIIKDIMIKGLGFAAVWKETLILAGMTFFFLSLSLKKFSIRLAQ
jgi:ABC-2 type transport system permease protein